MLHKNLPIFAVLATLFGLAAHFRFIASDEAFYNVAARLVWEGKLPYLDFFYPQTPLLPYFYGIFLGIFGESWETSRILTALLAATTGTFLFAYLRKNVGLKYALFAALLFVGSEMSLAWFTVTKTYALSSVLLFAAFMYAERAKEKGAASFFLCGLCLGLAVNVRLFFLVCGLPFLAAACLHPSRRRAALGLVAGGVVTALPHIYFGAVCPESWYFSNYGYHTLRSTIGSPAGEISQKLEVLKGFLCLGSQKFWAGGQETILLALNLAHVIWSITCGRRFSLASGVGFCLFAANFLPTPTWRQYFAPLTPFFLVGAVFFVRDLCGAKSKAFRVAAKLGMVILCVTYLSFTPHAVHRFLVPRTYRYQVNDRAPVRVWHMRTISGELNTRTYAKEVVLSQWPGYLFGSHASPAPRLENQFWVRVWKKLSPAQRESLHVADPEYLQSLVERHKIRVLVNGRRGREFARLTPKQHGYRLVFEKYGVQIFERRKTDLEESKEHLKN